MANPKYARNLTTSAERHYSITPSDSADLSPIPRALYFGTAGDVAIRDEKGTDITYTVTAGSILPFRPTRVLSTGTTATGIVGWL